MTPPPTIVVKTDPLPCHLPKRPKRFSLAQLGGLPQGDNLLLTGDGIGALHAYLGRLFARLDAAERCLGVGKGEATP